MKKYFKEPNAEQKGWLGIKGKDLGRDKQKHLVLGLAIFIISTVVFYFQLDTDYEKLNAAAQNGFGVTIAVAILKEIYDFILFKIGKKENWVPLPDIIATALIPFLITQLLRIFI